jgi:hypothetical protein
MSLDEVAADSCHSREALGKRAGGRGEGRKAKILSSSVAKGVQEPRPV